MITEYVGKSYLEKYSIFVPVDWDKNTFNNSI